MRLWNCRLDCAVYLHLKIHDMAITEWDLIKYNFSLYLGHYPYSWDTFFIWFYLNSLGPMSYNSQCFRNPETHETPETPEIPVTPDVISLGPVQIRFLPTNKCSTSLFFVNYRTFLFNELGDLWRIQSNNNFQTANLFASMVFWNGSNWLVNVVQTCNVNNTIRIKELFIWLIYSFILVLNLWLHQ